MPSSALAVLYATAKIYFIYILKLVRETRMSHDEAQSSVAEHMGNSLAVQGV